MNVYLYTSYHIEFLNAKNAYEKTKIDQKWTENVVWCKMGWNNV